MHICHCFKDFSLNEGGVERCIRYLSEAAIQAGHRVSVLVSRPQGSSEREFINGIEEIRTRPIFTIFKVPIMPNYYCHLSTINPDIVHSYGTIPGVTDVSIIYALLHNKRSVLHYQFDGNADSKIGMLFADIYNYSVNTYIVKKADRVLAPSRAYAETSTVLRRRIQGLEILPNGVDLTKFNPSIKAGSARGKYKLPDSNVIISTGRFVVYKGFEYLIKAMKYVKDGTLILVGNGQQEKYLKTLVEEQNIENVKFIGSIPYAELPQLYRDGDIYVQPAVTRGDAFPISILEAMACGLPVISSDLSGIHMMVTQECGFKVKPKDINGLADAINIILADSSLREKMGQAARRNAEKYGWDVIAKRILDIYQDLS